MQTEEEKRAGFPWYEVNGRVFKHGRSNPFVYAQTMSMNHPGQWVVMEKPDSYLLFHRLAVYEDGQAVA